MSFYHINLQRIFSDNLKQICLDVFRCDYDEVYGQNKERPFDEALTISIDHMYELHFWLQKSRVIENFKEISEESLEKSMNFVGTRIGTPRSLMQILGTEMIRGCYADDYHIKSTALRIHLSTDDISIIPDIRFLNEKKWLKSIDGHTLCVVGRQRERYGDFSSHPSESEMSSDTDFDYIINNTGTLEVLQNNIISVVKDIVSKEER